jgi:WhiB family redox-sensing transcriptional regulator
MIGVFGALSGVPRLDDANCLGLWTLFDEPEPGDADGRDANRAALELCRTCPSLGDCRTWVDSLPPRDRPTGVIAGRIRKAKQPRKQSGDQQQIA